MAATYQFLSRPAKLPKEWQPKLHEWNPYHCSHPDVAQAGWRKWSAEHPDWYAKRATSQHPDWYNRRRDTIRRVDYKNINWHYEQPSKPTSRNMDDFVPIKPDVQMKDVLKPMPPNRSFKGHTSYPKPFPYEIPMPNWGLYHPDHYKDPVILNHFPPIRYNGYK
ncbi:hypothetical protein SNE40_004144 [Patella caerulea]|uniref:Uncharacterized protein n=1 Tax=Patella caerulea TaxID=87958 RepID=A0AAN8KFU0_PATCE